MFMLGAAMSIFARSVRAPSSNSPARIRANRSRFSPHRPLAVRAVAPRLVPAAPVTAHLLALQIVDVGQPLVDQGHRTLVEALEVVGGVVRAVLPVEAEPADVLLDRAHELHVLRLRVRVVHAEVAEPAELVRDAEVQADRLGMADVQVAVRLRRKAGVDPPAAPAGGLVGGDDLPDEVESGVFGLGHAHACVLVHESAGARLRLRGGQRPINSSETRRAAENLQRLEQAEPDALAGHRDPHGVNDLADPDPLVLHEAV